MIMERTTFVNPVEKLKRHCKGRDPFAQYGEDNREWRAKAFQCMNIPITFKNANYLLFVTNLYKFAANHGCKNSMDQPVIIRQSLVKDWLNS
jgi:hypothetical protein